MLRSTKRGGVSVPLNLAYAINPNGNRISFNYLKPEGTDAFTQVTLSLGTLYHFSPELGRSRAYLRPVAK